MRLPVPNYNVARNEQKCIFRNTYLDSFPLGGKGREKKSCNFLTYDVIIHDDRYRIQNNPFFVSGEKDFAKSGHPVAILMTPECISSRKSRFLRITFVRGTACVFHILQINHRNLTIRFSRTRNLRTTQCTSNAVSIATSVKAHCFICALMPVKLEHA